jgi:large subunit ribosomal protein L10
MQKERKIRDAKEFAEKFRESHCLFLADFLGMNVAQMTRVRRELKRVNAEFKVLKNSVLRIASRGTPVEVLKERFVGPNVVILARDDAPEVAKVLTTISKDIPNLKIKAGLVGGRIVEPQDVARIATLPSRQVLLAKLVGTLEGPEIRLLFVLSHSIARLLATLNAIKEKRQKEA